MKRILALLLSSAAFCGAAVASSTTISTRSSTAPSTPYSWTDLAKLTAVQAASGTYQNVYVGPIGEQAVVSWYPSASRTDYPCSPPVGGVGTIGVSPTTGSKYACAPDYGLTGAWVSAWPVNSVPFIATMRAIPATQRAANQVVTVEQYASGYSYGGGTFVWIPAANVPVGTTPDYGVIIPPTGDTDCTTHGCWFRELGGHMAALTDYGCGNTAADGYCIQAALNAGRDLDFGGPEMTYTFAAAYPTVNVTGAGQRLIGHGAKVVYDARWGYGASPIWVSADGVRVSGLAFSKSYTTACAGCQFYWGVLVRSADDVEVDHITAQDVPAIRTDTTLANDGNNWTTPYASVNDGLLVHRVNIHDVSVEPTATATDSNIAAGTGAISLAYAKDFVVATAAVNGIQNAIVWWGGDSATNGATLSNPRWASGQIVNAVVHQGGIWGSMGNGVLVSNSKSYDAPDLGFDDEGGVGVTFSGSYCEGATNGCLAQYYYSTGLKFVGVTARQSTTTKPLITWNTHNASLQATSVSVEASIFEFTGTGLGELGATAGALPASVSFQNNKLKDVQVKLGYATGGGAAVATHDLLVSGNTLDFSQAAASAMCGLEVASMTALGTENPTHVVTGNVVKSAVTQPYGSRAICAVEETRVAGNVTISNNTTAGFPIDLYIREKSGSGIYQNWNILNNILTGQAYVRDSSITGSWSNVTLAGNRDYACPLPSTSNVTVSAATSAASAVGSYTLTFTTTPLGVYVGMYVNDLTNPSSVSNNWVTAVTSTTVTLGAAIASPGVSSGDSIQFSNWWNQGQQFLTCAPSAGGYIGQIQTTAGAPGTQKTFGAITP